MSDSIKLSYDKLYKIIVVGNNCTGKTTLCHNYINNSLLATASSTIGIDFHSSVMDVSGTKIKIILWDTAGQEAFRSLIRTYYKNTCGVVIVYDITSRRSFEDVKYWISEYDKHNTCNNMSHIHNPMIIGNKIDLSGGKYIKRKISYQEGLLFAKNNDCFFYELSQGDLTEIKRAFDTYIDYLVYNFTEKSCGCVNKIQELRDKSTAEDLGESCFKKDKLFSFCSVL